LTKQIPGLINVRYTHSVLVNGNMDMVLHIVAVITKPPNCIWKMMKMTKKRLINQLFTNILDSVLLNYCYYY